MCAELPKHRARIAEIAKLAGVGTATVDRVLNDRVNVRETTRQRVFQARDAIESGAAPQERVRPWRLKVFLPGEAGPSTDYLAKNFQKHGSRGNATIECVFTAKMEPAALARHLVACGGQGIDAVAFQALDDPRVHHAVEELKVLGIPCLSIMSGLQNNDLIGFVGIDNRAAGRTAAYMMGRLTRNDGAVLIVTGGQLYRGHEDREIGFRSALRGAFPHIQEAIVCSGQDDIEGNYNAASNILKTRNDIIGIYNLGGGNEGVANALRDSGLAEEIVYIGHNLSRKTRSYLLDGTMDIVLHVDVTQVAERAVEFMVSHLERRSFENPLLPTRLITRENTDGERFS